MTGVSAARARLSIAVLAAALLSLPLTGNGRAAEPATPAPAQALPAPGQAPGARPETVWRLPGPPGAMRVDGEDGALTWPVYVPPDSVAEVKRFQLAYKAAISVMPEASWLTLEINGKTIGRIPIAAPNRTKVLPFDLPPGTLASGWNAIRIGVSQRHRVDCSIDATYELWTELDAARTGLVGPRPTISSVETLAAMPSDGTGATPLHLLLPKEAGPDTLSRAIRVAERASLLGHFAQPVVDGAPGPSGLTIAVGTFGDLEGQQLLEGMAARNTGVQLGSTPGGGAILLVAAPSEADLDRLVEEMGKSHEPVGTEEGLRALAYARGVRIRPGDSVALAEVGLPSAAFSGRLFRSGFDVVLPPDAYLGDYGQAQLSVDGGYATGLAPGAVVIVRVNGTTDGVLKLDRTGGAKLQNHIIHMPLTAFRPGRNHIEIEAQVPARSDEQCDTLASIGAKERFLLLGTSSLTVPRLARIGQFPGLSASFAGGFRVTQAEAPQIFLPRLTPALAGAAATLLANAAVQTGRPTDARLSRERPKAGDAPTVMLAVAVDIPDALLAASGIDGKTLTRAWGAGSARREVTGAVATRRAAEAAGGEDGTQQDRDRLDAWGENVDSRGGWYGEATAALAWLGGLFTDSLRAAGIIASAPSRVSITADTSFVIAQGLLDRTAVTLVTAADEGEIARGVARITQARQLRQVSGRAVSLNEVDDGLDTVPTRDAQFFPTQPFSVENYRLIAAGWLSNHAAWYIGAVLLMTLILGGSTWAALGLSRRPG